jgi:hypothetical protein
MNRWLLPSMIVAAGIAVYFAGGSPALAADKDPQANSTPAKGEGEESPTKRIDRAIQTYESRAESELEHTRKEIDRMRKELGEMMELQIEMAISLAELQAELRVAAATTNLEGGNDSSSSGSAASSAEQEQRRLCALELTRELRAVLDNLRGLVAQKRNETDQLVIQLRNLRVQQRQFAAEREARKQQPQGAGPSKD